MHGDGATDLWPTGQKRQASNLQKVSEGGPPFPALQVGGPPFPALQMVGPYAEGRFLRQSGTDEHYQQSQPQL